MTQPDSDLFQVRLNEQGKDYIRKFASISYVMMALVIAEAGISLYWSIKLLVMDYTRYAITSYDRMYPYVTISFSLLSIAANVFYYLRFPRVLLRSIKNNDELGANQAFGLLFKGAVIYLLWLLLVTASMIWSLVIR